MDMNQDNKYKQSEKLEDMFDRMEIKVVGK